MSNELNTQLAGNVLTLSINRPERRNALSADVVKGLTQAMQDANANPEVRVIVITGTGHEAFCAGADLQGGAFEFDYSRPRSAYADLLRASQACLKPLIAKVNGACMAGGIGLLAMCDMAIASRQAVFGLPEVKVGVFPMQVLSILQGKISEKWLSRLCLTGETVNAEMAERIGIVNEAVDDLDEAVAALAAAIQRNAPAAIRRGLYAIKHARGLSFEQSIAFTESQIGLLALTKDAKEGIAAFKEKRKPVWSGQ